MKDTFVSGNQVVDTRDLEAMLSAEIATTDPFVAELIALEASQQRDKLILIPSVSAAPNAVLQALGSVFQNVCAEGYPAEKTRLGDESAIRNLAWHLASNRRYADRRFYKGVNYVDMIESLAQQRCATAFASDGIDPADIFVNTQTLSGGTANLAVYNALLQPGDTIMGMSLSFGGHLSHGATVNLSGQLYNIVPYEVDPQTEKLDYAAIRKLAHEHRPKLIIAGYTSYPWAPDWGNFREIADEVGAYLLADIAHTAGLVIAGMIANPVGYADVTTLTTNKTLCGPRASVVLTLDAHIAKAIDRTIFPGMQGAPHPNKFAAIAVAIGIAQTSAFQAMQAQIVANAKALAHGLQRRGIRLAYGGTDTHLMVLDLKSISVADNILYGEPAARILELVGLIVNRNSVPGDSGTALATGIRIGTPWVTQRGLDETDMDQLAELIHTTLTNIHPFTYTNAHGLVPRGKIDHHILSRVRDGVAKLIDKAIDQRLDYADPLRDTIAPCGLTIKGVRAKQFVQEVVTANIADLRSGASCNAFVLNGAGDVIAPVVVTRCEQRGHFSIQCNPANFDQLFAWLTAMSDGYTLFDADVYRKIQGPVALTPHHERDESVADFLNQAIDTSDLQRLIEQNPSAWDLNKPFFVGQAVVLPYADVTEIVSWDFSAPNSAELRQTPLFAEHKTLRARMVPFADWQMPVRYRSVLAEHQAVRQAAGLFDIGHMAIIEVTGDSTIFFLDAVFSNSVARLNDNESCYGYILTPDAEVIDDAIVYRFDETHCRIVVNAANEHRVWDWFQQVNQGTVTIDFGRPNIHIDTPASLHLLREPSKIAPAQTILALQGPASKQILECLIATEQKRQFGRLKRNTLLTCHLINQIEVTIARTGYTGEAIGYELFVAVEDVVTIWRMLLDAGEPFGLLPIGLGARDSLRIEAGLPLWGHELAGPYQLSPIEAGFRAFVKFNKPFFIGRTPLLTHNLAKRKWHVVRFKVTEQRARRPQMGDPVLNAKGQIIGHVTSCSIDAKRNFIGMAVIPPSQKNKLASISLLPLQGKSLAESLWSNKRMTMPVPATILN